MLAAARAALRARGSAVSALSASARPFATKQALELRYGDVFEEKGRLLEVMKMQHVTQGRQLGNVQLELRDVLTGSKSQSRRRPSETISTIDLFEKPATALYIENDTVHCMRSDTFDQVEVPRGTFGEGGRYLADGCEVVLVVRDEPGSGNPDQLITAHVPKQVVRTVTYAAPHIKGETITNSFKPAEVEGGASVQVPGFVVKGDRIVVDTANHTFMRRAKPEDA